MHHMRPMHCVPQPEHGHGSRDNTHLLCADHSSWSWRRRSSLIGRSWCLMKLIRHKDMGIEQFARLKELRLNREPLQLDFLPCWISVLRVEAIAFVRAWRIMRFDVYICPGVDVCVSVTETVLFAFLGAKPRLVFNDSKKIVPDSNQPKTHMKKSNFKWQHLQKCHKRLSLFCCFVLGSDFFFLFQKWLSNDISTNDDQSEAGCAAQ